MAVNCWAAPSTDGRDGGSTPEESGGERDTEREREDRSGAGQRDYGAALARTETECRHGDDCGWWPGRRGQGWTGGRTGCPSDRPPATPRAAERTQLQDRADSILLLGLHELDQVHDAVGVAVLVVIPGTQK